MEDTLRGFDNIVVESNLENIKHILYEFGLKGYEFVHCNHLKEDLFLLFFKKECELELLVSCENCKFFQENSSYCEKNNYSTTKNDSCDLWEERNIILEIDSEIEILDD
jgi:hypothetical protein